MSAGHNPFERLKELIIIEREDVQTIVFYAIGIGLMSLATPVAVQSLVNTIAFGALFQPLIVLTIILLVLVGFGNFLAGLQFYVVEMLQRRLFLRMFDAISHRLMNVDHAKRDELYLPELTNRFLDVVTLQKTAAVLLLETLAYILQTVIGMILLAFYHPLLLAFDLFLIGTLAFILFVMGKNGIDTCIEQSKAKYAAAAWLETIAANPLLAKSEQNQAFLKQQTENIAGHYLTKCIDHFRILARQNTGALVLHTVANTLLLGMGGWMVIERQLSLGQLIAAELVLSAMIYGLTRLGKTLDNFYDMLASTDKLDHLLALPEAPQTKNLIDYMPEPQAPGPAGPPCQVEISNAALPLNPCLDVLKNGNLKIKPGERAALTFGNEKGSVFDLIFGLRLPSAGYIALDGVDLREINLGKLRNNIALVREAEIIEATIADNINFGRNLPLSEIKAALVTVGLMDAAAELPAGVNTILLNNGKPLSAEQCLRLTIARAIAGKPRLLMIDQTLDKLEARFQMPLFESLADSQNSWTLLVGTSNKGIASRCGREIQIDNGGFKETGTLPETSS